jgi:hypothetical protein
MGLLEDFNVDLDEVKAVSGFSIPDPGFYNFEIGAAFIKEGSTNHPDDAWIIIEYLLETEDGADGGKISDMFALPKDASNLTKAELTAMGGCWISASTSPRSTRWRARSWSGSPARSRSFTTRARVRTRTTPTPTSTRSGSRRMVRRAPSSRRPSRSPNPPSRSCRVNGGAADER